MVKTALKFIERNLGAFMAERSNLQLTAVSLSNLVNRDGSPVVSNEANIFITLLQLEEEKFESKKWIHRKTSNGRIDSFPPIVWMNAYVLFSAVRQDYETALRDISTVMLFFQKYPLFKSGHFPDLNEDVQSGKDYQRIEELAFHIHPLSIEQHSYIWSVLGAKYTPSVLYKMRVLSVFDRETDREGAPIEEIDYATEIKK